MPAPQTITSLTNLARSRIPGDLLKRSLVPKLKIKPDFAAATTTSVLPLRNKQSSDGLSDT
jgi:hypothetical protein